MSLTMRGPTYRPTYKIIFGSMRDQFKGGALEATNVQSFSVERSTSSAAGKFNIVLDFAYVTINGAQYRWDEVLIPNDYVEIWTGREGTDELRVVMRGWIDGIRVAEAAGDQSPALRLVIDGRDYGKIWLVTRILNIYPPLQPIYYVEQYHIDWASTDLPKLFDQVLKNIMQPYVDFHKKLCPIVADFVGDADVIRPDADQLRMIALQFQTLMEPAYSILHSYQNEPWIELFCEDYDNAPTYIMRWAAYRGPNGQMETPFGSYPREITQHYVDEVNDIYEFNLGLSDIDVFNWFRTVNVMLPDMQSDQALIYYKYGVMPYIIGKSIDMYGFRRLEPSTNFLPTGQGKHQADIAEASNAIEQLVWNFNIWLVKMYGSNYLLENGSILLKGKPEYKIGEELVYNGRLRFYIEGVRHDYTHNQPYRVTLTLTRGMAISGLGGDYKKVDPYSIPESFPTNDGMPFDLTEILGLLQSAGNDNPTVPDAPTSP